MINRDSIGGYDEKLLVTIQKVSDSKIQVLYWGNTLQMNSADICTYDLYENEDLAESESDMKVCGYFEPGRDVRKWQKPMLIKQVDAIALEILNLVVNNALNAVDINIYAEPEGQFLADLMEDCFLKITEPSNKKLIAMTEIVIRVCMDYESYNGQEDVKKRIQNKEFLSFWQPELEVKLKDIEARQELKKTYKRLSESCIQADLKLLQMKTEALDFESYFERLTRRKAEEAVRRREQKIATNAENAKGQWLKEISAQMRDDIGAEAKKLSELRHFKHWTGMSQDLWEKKRREYLQKNRGYLIYWCFLMKCTESEVEDLLTVAQIFPYPTNPGEQLLYSFMKRGDYDKKHLQDTIDEAFPDDCLDIGQLLGMEIRDGEERMAQKKDNYSSFSFR